MALPARWAQASADARGSSPAASLDAWWRAFNDPLLDELMVEAVAGDTDVASAKAKIREARATRREAEAGLGPSRHRQRLGHGIEERTGRRRDSRDDRRERCVCDPAWSFQAGLDASWELDLFGGKRRDAEAAVYSEQAAEEDLRSTLLTLVGDVGADYAEARGYQARIALAQRTLASQRRTADLTRVKFEAGAASGADAAKADAQAASTAADIPTYEAGYAEAVHRLSRADRTRARGALRPNAGARARFPRRAGRFPPACPPTS